MVFHRSHPKKKQIKVRLNLFKGFLKQRKCRHDAIKSYIGHLVFDDEAEIFQSEVINTKDVITFQS